MAQRITQVDSFTDRRFSGNPAAVCVLSEPADPRWMQDVAAEMNLSETAFAQRLDGESRFHLRWFTPNSEVDLCGHATLATAHVLWEEAHIAPDQVPHFETRSGPLLARRGPTGIELDFPREAVESELTSPAELALLEAAIPAPHPLRGLQSVRSAGRAGGRGDARRPSPRHPQARAAPLSGRDRDEPLRQRRVRLRLPFLRALRRGR